MGAKGPRERGRGHGPLLRRRSLESGIAPRETRMKIHSDSFGNGQPIPPEFAMGARDGKDGFGGNRNPHLAWSEVPDGTKSFVLLCIDTDAPTDGALVADAATPIPVAHPRGDFVHWAVAGIPADVLPKDKMAEVMVDIHLLEATVNLTVTATDKAAFNEKGDQIDVYKKHNITRKQYEDSYLFYTRHPELLGEIYQQVLNELSKMQAEVMNGKK